MIVMGAGLFGHKQKVKGVIVLLFEMAFIVYMVLQGGARLAALPGLGTETQGKVWNEAKQIYEPIKAEFQERFRLKIAEGKENKGKYKEKYNQVQNEKTDIMTKLHDRGLVSDDQLMNLFGYDNKKSTGFGTLSLRNPLPAFFKTSNIPFTLILLMSLYFGDRKFSFAT